MADAREMQIVAKKNHDQKERERVKTQANRKLSWTAMG